MNDTMTNLEIADMRLGFAAKDVANAIRGLKNGFLHLALTCIDDAVRDLTKVKANIENEMKGGTP
jgi:hypothetical protein